MIKKYWLRVQGIAGLLDVFWFYSDESRKAAIDRLPDDVAYSTTETEEPQ